jgi:hypothetical protein
MYLTSIPYPFHRTIAALQRDKKERDDTNSTQLADIKALKKTIATQKDSIDLIK